MHVFFSYVCVVNIPVLLFYLHFSPTCWMPIKNANTHPSIHTKTNAMLQFSNAPEQLPEKKSWRKAQSQRLFTTIPHSPHFLLLFFRVCDLCFCKMLLMRWDIYFLSYCLVFAEQKKSFSERESESVLLKKTTESVNRPQCIKMVLVFNFDLTYVSTPFTVSTVPFSWRKKERAVDWLYRTDADVHMMRWRWVDEYE